jgi:hypothetical protein
VACLISDSIGRFAAVEDRNGMPEFGNWSDVNRKPSDRLLEEHAFAQFVEDECAQFYGDRLAFGASSPMAKYEYLGGAPNAPPKNDSKRQ